MVHARHRLHLQQMDQIRNKGNKSNIIKYEMSPHEIKVKGIVMLAVRVTQACLTIPGKVFTHCALCAGVCERPAGEQHRDGVAGGRPGAV